jgi:hypothetical protein
VCLRVSGEQIWTAKVHPPRSTAEASFRSPPAILPLGGGGSGIERATLERSGLIRLDQRCSGEFRTPLAILPLMGGGGVWNGVACEVGPVSCHVAHRVVLPYCHLYSSQSRNRARSYWPVASLVRVRRLQSRTIRHLCSVESRIIERRHGYLTCDHDPRSHGSRERERTILR